MNPNADIFKPGCFQLNQYVYTFIPNGKNYNKVSSLEMPISNNQLSRWGILANSTLNPEAKDFKPGGNYTCLNNVTNNISVTENNGTECHDDGNIYTILKAFKLKYINNVIITHLDYK